MSRFSSLHPTVSFFYFVSVLTVTMFLPNPVMLIIALLGGLLFFIKIQKNIRFIKEFGFYLTLFVIIALSNPLFSHKGVTPLFFLNGNPVTLEALLYGINIAVMLIAVVYWFRCFNQIITEDKLLFLFGKVSPKTALLLSSALRFIPLIKEQAGKIRKAQTTMGLYASDTWTDKLKGTLRVYSALITWGLENAIDTGSSMKARGYGLKGRKHYSLYTFRKSDGLFISFVLVLDAIIIAITVTGRLDFSFYPQITLPTVNIYRVSAMIAFAALCLLPFILEVKEGLQWKYYKSKI